MGLTQSLKDLGTPVVFYPRLGRFFGSNNAAIFYAQLAYWSERTDSPHGVYKTAEEWENETGLTEGEQRGARKKLAAIGGLIETRDRWNHRIYYKLVDDVIDRLFADYIKDIAKNPLNQGTVKTTVASVKITVANCKNHGR